jgi:hypothetical protein
MFSRNVVAIGILEGGSEVIFAITHARMLFFTGADVSTDSLPVDIIGATYARTALVAFAGTSAFSTALTKPVFTLSAN